MTIDSPGFQESEVRHSMGNPSRRIAIRLSKEFLKCMEVHRLGLVIGIF